MAQHNKVARLLRSGGLSAFCLLALLLVTPKTGLAMQGNGVRQLHLGTAAGPYGLSSAVGDFDADNQLDFAVADRTGSTAQGYDFSLKFDLSREKGQTFHFRSRHPELSLSVLDLDNDRDLDVVLTHAITDEIVAVWINNGHGDFQQGTDADLVHAQVQLAHPRIFYASKAAPVAIAVSLRRPAAYVALLVWFNSGKTPSAGFSGRTDFRRPRDISASSISPRAPPALSFS